MSKKKGTNAPGQHLCSVAGGPGSKGSANKYGAAHRNAKYRAQWERTAKNKAARIERQARRFGDKG